MTTPAEARLDSGPDGVRGARRREAALRTARATRAEFGCGELPEARSVPGSATIAVCIGSVATVGGLVVAALLRPGSLGTAWLISTLVIAAVGGALSAPAVRGIERHQARRM